jgi:hypothetical protein
MATISEEISIFDNYDIHGECSFRLILDYDGKVIIEEGSIEPKLCICIYKNPLSYPEDEEGIVTQKTWNYITSGIREARDVFCKGEISKSFFNKEKTQKNIDVIFTLSLFEKNSDASKQTKSRLIGFCMCVDRTLYEDNDESYSTLYIDVICGNTQDIRTPAPVSPDGLWTEPTYNLNDEHGPQAGIKVGKVLLNIIELYGINNGFEQMKLSALSYVINYYRRIGYTHITDRISLEEPELKRIAEIVVKKKFKSEEDVDEQLRIERAIQLCDNNVDKLKENLKLYLQLEMILTDEETNEYLQKIVDTISISNLNMDDGKDGIYDLLVKLTQLEFAPNCTGTSIPIRRNWLQQIDGEFITKCIDDGFTMRKSLLEEDGWERLIQE